MKVIRRAVVADQQTITGPSPSRRWMLASGIITAEVSFDTDLGVSCTGLVVDVQGSITNNHFFTLATHTFSSTERANKSAMFHIVDKPVVWVRTNIAAITQIGVGDVKVTINLLSYD